MCLITKDKNVYIADKDIRVYKLFHFDQDVTRDHKNIKYVKTRFQDFSYTIGILYQFDIEHAPVGEYGYFDDKSYIDNDFQGDYYKIINDGFVIIEKGIHSCRTIQRIKCLEKQLQIICRCIIPKGSKYMIDKSNLIVSNQIIVDKIVGYSEYSKDYVAIR
jgi:hypothetical protein